MKDDERRFFLAVANETRSASTPFAGDGVYVRDIIGRIGINHKRCWYLLDKWSKKGLYEWGVTIDLGWLTPEGKEFANTLRAQS